MASRAAMAKTPTSSRNSRERGAALLEAAIALGLVAIIAAAGFSAFATANRFSAAADEKLRALTLAENGVELASAPAFLRRALEDGEAIAAGENWRVVAEPYDGDDGLGPLALIRIRAEGGQNGAVALETLRSIPR